MSEQQLTKSLVEMSKVQRVVNVEFTNGLPYSLLSEVSGVDYSVASPEECARKLFEDEAELALIPTAEFLSHGGLSALEWGIACNGPSKSVLLFSKGPLEKIKRVYIDRASKTSVVLLRIILKAYDLEGVDEIEFYRSDSDNIVNCLDGNSAGLVIGDAALKLAQKTKPTLDLSDEWHKLTGLPFVFAVWAYKNDLPQEFLQEINAQAWAGHSRIEEIVYARESIEPKSREELLSYLQNNITYRIGESEAGALLEFGKLGRACGLFPEVGEIKQSGLAEENPSKIAGLTSQSLSRSVDSILSDAASGKRISILDANKLATNASLADLGLASDRRRAAIHPESKVSFIVDRNINYTNICNVYCSFCAFYSSAKTRENGYILTKDQLRHKMQSMVDAGGYQVLLQGGLHPDLGIEYYEDLFSWMKESFPTVNLHALSADEIWHIVKISQISLTETFERLIAAGLGSFPGGGAEILVDRVRSRIARLKTTTSEWLEAHRTAHRLGLTSTCTMMFGVKESWMDRVMHMHKLRSLQDETGGFTAFIAWPFQSDNTSLKPGDTSAPEYLRVQAISRLFIDNIDNIQSSWVTQGPAIGQVGLLFGANDFGSVMFEENVVSAAGTTYCMDEASIRNYIAGAGFDSWKRDVHYGNIP